MCVINDPADVKSTNILVCPDQTGTRQLVVYSNIVATEWPNNAMILPVPHPDTVTFHDLTSYSDIFNDCDASFPVEKQFALLNAYGDGDDGDLEVHDVGSYQVSICKTLAD